MERENDLDEINKELYDISRDYDEEEFFDAYCFPNFGYEELCGTMIMNWRELC